MIRIEGLSHRIGAAAILRDIDLTLPRGKLIALIGPNGAGKSTLLRLVARLEPLQAGRIEIDGLDLARTPTERLALAMAVMGQQTRIASRLRVAELVAFGRWPHHHGRPRAADREAVRQALDAFGLTALKDRFLDEISGGQAQRAQGKAPARCSCPPLPVPHQCAEGSVERPLRTSAITAMTSAMPPATRPATPTPEMEEGAAAALPSISMPWWSPWTAPPSCPVALWSSPAAAPWWWPPSPAGLRARVGAGCSGSLPSWATSFQFTTFPSL